MHEVPVNRLGGLSLPRKSVVMLTDRPDMTFDVYRGRITTIKHYSQTIIYFGHFNTFLNRKPVLETYENRIDPVHMPRFKRLRTQYVIMVNTLCLYEWLCIVQ